MATPKKIKTPFDEFLRDPSNKKILHKNGISVKHFIRTKLNLYVVQSPQGQTLCLFEVGKDFAKPSENKDASLLEKMPPFYLKIPGYRVIYQRAGSQENGMLASFNVKKMTPKERLVGDFSPREFIRFLASTIIFCRKHKETA